MAHVMLLLYSTNLKGGFLWFSDYMELSGGINGNQIEWYEEEYERKMILMLSKRKNNQMIFS